MVYWLCWLGIVLIASGIAFILKRQKYKKALAAAPTYEELHSEYLEKLNGIKSHIVSLKDESNELLKNRKYDHDMVVKVSAEVLWKADYARAEYNSRHYTERNIEDIISSTKRKKNDDQTTTVDSSEPAEAEEKRLCKNCGNELLPGAGFCGKCGTKQ